MFNDYRYQKRMIVTNNFVNMSIHKSVNTSNSSSHATADVMNTIRSDLSKLKWTNA